jgi:uncharacterized membrane protein YbhN (UPF0104 family)
LVIDGDAAEADTPEAAPPRSGFFSSRLFAFVRVGASLAIVAGLIFKLSPRELANTFRDADPWLFVSAFALMVAVQALVVLKWLTLLRARGVAAHQLQVARAYCMGNLLSTVLPTAVGGDVYRVYRIQRESSARATDVTMTVLYERATGYAAMSCFGALGAAFHFGSLMIGLLALAGGTAAALLLSLLLPRLPLPALPADHFLRNLISHRRELLVVYRMFAFSLLIQALYISTIALTGRAFGAHLSWWYWAFTTWLVAVALLLPITLGGLGVRESSFSGLVRRGGGTAAHGAATGFALGILLVVVNAFLLLLIEIAERLGLVPELPVRTTDATRGTEAIPASRG